MPPRGTVAIRMPVVCHSGASHPGCLLQASARAVRQSLCVKRNVSCCTLLLRAVRSGLPGQPSDNGVGMPVSVTEKPKSGNRKTATGEKMCRNPIPYAWNPGHKKKKKIFSLGNTYGNRRYPHRGLRSLVACNSPARTAFSARALMSSPSHPPSRDRHGRGLL